MPTTWHRAVPSKHESLPQSPTGAPPSLPWVVNPEGSPQYSNHAATFTSRPPLSGQAFHPASQGNHICLRTCAFHQQARWSLQGAGGRGNCLSFPQCCGRPRYRSDFHPVSGASEPRVGPPVTSSPPPPGSSNLQHRNWEGQERRVGFPANREGLAGRFLQDPPPLRRKEEKRPSLSPCFCFS